MSLYKNFGILGIYISHHRYARYMLYMLIVICIYIVTNMLYIYPLVQLSSPKLYDRYGVLLYDIKYDYRQDFFLDISQIPHSWIRLVIDREDRRYMEHHGIDIYAIFRSIYQNTFGDQSIRQGGSTIDQQVIKLSQNNFERNIWHKIQEILGSINLNFHYNKNDILLYYSNNLTFGNGIRGLKSACQIYFHTDCGNLSDYQLTYLYTRSKYPNNQKLSDYQAYIYNLSYSGDRANVDDFLQIQKSIKLKLESQAPIYTQRYISHHPDIVSGDIYTSLDLGLYQDIQNILNNYKKLLGSRDASDACVVVADDRGEIISMNTLRHSDDDIWVNGCDSPRQVGSSIKPFLYLYAMYHLGRKGDTKIIDEDIQYPGQLGIYEPKNFDMKYHGEVSISQALGSSLNIPAVKTLDAVGLLNFWNWMKSISAYIGIGDTREDDPDRYGLSLALGSREMTPIDRVRLYSIFIRSSDPYISYLSPYIHSITTILSDNHNRLLSFPQNNRFDIANTFVKSGTSRGFVDGWVCGGTMRSTNNRVVCIWVGNYDGRPSKDSGYNTAGILRKDIIKLI